jgi:hypothetical protein
MKQQDQGTWDGCHTTNRTVISRRAAIGSSGLAVLSVLSASALGQEGRSGPPREIQERMEQFRVFSERMGNATSAEERAKIMAERSAWEQTRAVEDIKGQLGVSEEEWKVIQPRVEAVYNLLHPKPQFGGRNARQMSPVDQRKNELREILNKKDAPADQVKAKLTAVRAAQLNAAQELTRARQDLRQILTLHQEATLVLNGLLD